MNEVRFFKECLDLEYEGMEEVRKAVAAEDYEAAKKAFASYIRNALEPERFFSVPYEVPENAYLLPEETVPEACERVVRDHIMVAVGVACDFGKEKEVDWFANPTFNDYKEWTWQLSRHPEWKMLAEEYRKTGEERYAKRTAELFESWYHQAAYPGDVSGYDTKCWRTIECGIRMGANWPHVLFCLYQSEAFTDQVLVDWYASVWEHGERLCRNRTHGNWLIMEMNGLAHIGILYPQLKQSKEWLNTAFACLEEELDRQVYADGFQYELSTVYHEVVVNNYQRVLEMAKAFDVTVPESILKKLENACLIDVKLMMPDGRIPSINDGKWFESKHLLERKQRILPNVPEMNWVLSDKKEGKEPEYKSLALPYSGFMIMRDGWTQDATWGFFDGAPFGRGHQHEDKLSLLVYAKHKVLITEGGNYAYDDSEMRKYVLSTRAHNTVMTDGMEQNRRRDYRWADEDIKKKADLTWTIGEAADYAESTYDEGYGPDADKSVTHNRRVYFVKKAPEGTAPFFIAVDRMTAKEQHTYRVLWHADSENPVVSEKGAAMDDINICVSGSNLQMSVVKGQEEPVWQGFRALSQRQGDYVPVNCVMADVTGVCERIVTVLAPHEAGENSIVSVEAGKNVEDTSLTLRFADGGELTLNENDMKQER